MGCGVSDGCKKDDRRKGDRIDSNMEQCYIGEFDDIFKEVRDLLQVMEEVRYGLRETVEDIKEMCEIERLMTPTFDECIKVWLWSISANNGGSLARAGFTVSKTAPFIEVNCSGCTWEAWWIQDYFTKFVKTALEMPEKAAETLVALVSLTEKAMDIDPAGAIEKADLNPFEAVKAAAAFAENVNTMKNGLVRAREIAQIIADAVKQITTLQENINVWIADVDTYGKLAYEKSLWRPSQIVREIHPGPKKTPEQLLAYEELVARNKCTCPKCLKEIEEQAKKDVKK